MDMLQFFQTVLPSDGFHFICELVLTPGRGRGFYFKQTPFIEFDEMVECAQRLDQQGKNVYFSCSSFKEIIYKRRPGGYEYASGRTKENARSQKALWLDIDVGKLKSDGSLKDGCYATKQDAVRALSHVVKTVDLPTPLLVGSGNGIHAYWPFTEAIPSSEWLPLAHQFRLINRHLGLMVDPSRDVDLSSVLRPVGAYNRGVGREPKLVVAKTVATPVTAAYLKELFDAFILTHELEVAPLVAHAISGNLPSHLVGAFSQTNDLASKAAYPPASLEQAAERCAQVAAFRATGGDSEPVWFALLGLAKHCEGGDALAHEWSAVHVEYDQVETATKMSQWAKGPPTCDHFESLAPAPCQSCPHRGTVKSPIQLGYIVPTEAPVVASPATEARPAFGTGEEVEMAPESAPIPHWPVGYRVTNNILNAIIPNEQGVPENHRLASPLFYPMDRVKLEDGTYGLRIRMQVRENQWREFDLPTKQLASVRDLKSCLSAYEIVVYNDKLTVAYMQEYLQQLRKLRDEVNTFTQFGWQNDFKSVLIGESLISATGITRVRVSTQYVKAQELREAFVVKGTKQQWIDGVNTLYNRANGEPYQYAICANSFGSLLTPLLGYEEWNGIPLALTSDRSGLGKSTVAKIGINALCSASRTMVADATAKAIIGRASVMKNLPVLFDEVTKSLRDSNDLSDVLYALSNGKPRIGMQSDGRERDPLPPYRLIACLTGNKNILFQTAESKTNPEAVQMRVFEIALEDYPLLDTMVEESALHAAHHEVALDLVNNVTGVLAEEYIRFVIQNKALVIQKLHHTATVIITALGGNASKERFYAYHMACTLVGGWIGRKLGYISFDLNALKHWAHQHILKMRGSSSEFNMSTGDKFSALLSDQHGHILITREFDTLASRINGKTELPLWPMRGRVTTRLVLGSETERPKMFITVRAIDEWCKEQGINALQFRREMMAARIIRSYAEKGRIDKEMYLSRGVPSVPTGKSRCLEIDYAIAQGYIDEFIPSVTNVVPIVRQVGPVQAEPTGT